MIGGQSIRFRSAVPVFGKVMLFGDFIIRFEIVDDFDVADFGAPLIRTTDVQNDLEYIYEGSVSYLPSTLLSCSQRGDLLMTSARSLGSKYSRKTLSKRVGFFVDCLIATRQSCRASI